MKADKLLRWAERSWLLLIDGVNEKTAWGVALSKSEDYYTQVINCDKDDPNGFAVYTYHRHTDEADDLPTICESKEWQIKRLKHAIGRHSRKASDHLELMKVYKLQLSLITSKGEN